jgi:hypothetical protein
MREDELDLKCEELFLSRPIPFIPKKGDNYALEKEMEVMLSAMNVTIPVMHVKG